MSLKPNNTKSANGKSPPVHADEGLVCKADQIKILLPEIARLRIKKKSWREVCDQLKKNNNIYLSESQMRHYWCIFRNGRMPEEVIIDDTENMLKNSSALLIQQLEIEYEQKLRSQKRRIGEELHREVIELRRAIFVERSKAYYVEQRNRILRNEIEQLNMYKEPSYQSKRSLQLKNYRLTREAEANAHELEIMKKVCKKIIGRSEYLKLEYDIDIIPLIKMYGPERVRNTIETLLEGRAVGQNSMDNNNNNKYDIIKMKAEISLLEEALQVNTNKLNILQKEYRLMKHALEQKVDSVDSMLDVANCKNIELEKIIDNLSASSENQKIEAEARLKEIGLKHNRLVKRIKKSFADERRIAHSWAHSAYKAMNAGDKVLIERTLSNWPCVLEATLENNPWTPPNNKHGKP